MQANILLPQCLWIPDIQLGAADNEKGLTAMSHLSLCRAAFSVHKEKISPEACWYPKGEQGDLALKVMSGLGESK